MNVDIADILKTYIDTLPFKDKVGGLVKAITYTQSDGEKSFRKTIPVDCGVTHADCIRGRYTDLIPNSKYKSIIYFEDLGITTLDRTTADFNFESRLKLVCWLNLQKLGKEDCSASALAIATILNTIPTGFLNSSPYTRIQIRFTGQDPKSAAIFSRYSYDEAVNQYLMYPYDYFALNLSIRFTIPKTCIPAWSNDPEIDCIDNQNQ